MLYEVGVSYTFNEKQATEFHLQAFRYRWHHLSTNGYGWCNVYLFGLRDLYKLLSQWNRQEGWTYVQDGEATMKIIRKGKLPSEDMFEGECYNCHSILQEKRGELKVQYDQRDNDSFAHAKCPVCGESAVLHPKQKGK
jgi:hypothetical protein